MPRLGTHDAVFSAFARYFDVHPSNVESHHDLRHDWGIDACELEWLVQNIEDAVGIQLDDYNMLSELHTVGQLARLFRAHEVRAEYFIEEESRSPSLPLLRN